MEGNRSPREGIGRGDGDAARLHFTDEVRGRCLEPGHGRRAVFKQHQLAQLRRRPTSNEIAGRKRDAVAERLDGQRRGGALRRRRGTSVRCVFEGVGGGGGGGGGVPLPGHR
jgi:hypothetical protein